MKKLFGLCAVMALITGGVVLSDEVASIVEQNADDAAQAVESAVNDSDAQPILEALPEQEILPEQEALPEQDALPEQTETPLLTPSEAVENALPDNSQTIQPDSNTQFILGVITSPIPPMVRAQINLPGESGLFVQTIKPNGPAAQAGVLPFDIISAIDGTPVSNTDELAAAVQKAAGKPQKLTVLRHGKALTLDITAQPSNTLGQNHGLVIGKPFIPSPFQFIDPLSPNFNAEEDDSIVPSFPKLQQFMERQRQQMDNMRQRMEAMENAMRQGMPGFKPFTPAPAPNGALTLPQQQMNDPNAQVQRDSFSVQVQKNGNEPAIIKIQENGNEYIVDENSIDQLPENVRNRLNFKIKTNDK
ncbi:MAG: PDZ domain-containing protein [Thermoguttaceae bacterium]|nr:PDZ domain-containing protein [Thermoguttaceae bacterium]